MTVINITTGEVRDNLTAKQLFEWVAENPTETFTRLLTGKTVEIETSY